MSDLPAKPEGRARPSRAQADNADRGRRRIEGTHETRQNLSTFGANLDRANYAYYWALNRPGRIEELTKYDDWDLVEKGEIGVSPERHGMTENGASLQHVLVRKPLDMDRADRDAREQGRRDMEKQTMAGQPTNLEGGGLKDAFYQPNDVNSLSRGPVTTR